MTEALPTAGPEEMRKEPDNVLDRVQRKLERANVAIDALQETREGRQAVYVAGHVLSPIIGAGEMLIEHCKAIEREHRAMRSWIANLARNSRDGAVRTGAKNVLARLSTPRS